jgi:hypothetical protein
MASAALPRTMIEITCKKCGERHERPDQEAGTLIFCECGQANRVPWPAAVAPETFVPVAYPIAPPAEESPWAEATSDRPTRRASTQRDPVYCFNHQDILVGDKCSACGLGFCDQCIVRLHKQVLCGPCKNLRVRNLLKPGQSSAKALISLVLGLVGGLIGFCAGLAPTTTPGNPEQGILFPVLGSLLPGAALLLGCVALRDIEEKPRLGGRAVAMTGVVTGLVGVLWCVRMLGAAILHQK